MAVVLSMLGSDWNTLGIAQALKARTALTAKERRNAWATALYYWDQGISAESNHLPCLLNRLHAVWSLGLSFTVGEEALALLRQLELDPDKWKNIHSPDTDGYGLVWKVSSLPFHTEDNPDPNLPAADQYLYYLARWIAETQTLVYKPEAIPFWRLVTAIHPRDLQARAVVGLGLAKNLQIEGIYHLRQNQIIATTEETLKWADVCYQIALEFQTRSQKSKSTSMTVAKVSVPYEGYTISLESDLNSVVTHCYLAQGKWFEQEVDFVKSYLKPGMVFLDIGANIGIYTLAAAQKVGPEGRVVAFEPTPNCADILKYNVNTNHLSQVTVIQCALGKETRRAYLLETEDSVYNRVLDIDTLTGITHPVKIVEMITLDEWWNSSGNPSIDMIKIDVVLDSLDIIQGGKTVIKNCNPIIQIEAKDNQGFVSQETASCLSDLGYTLFAYNSALNELSLAQKQARSFSAINLIAVPRARYHILKECGMIEVEPPFDNKTDLNLYNLLEENQ